MMRLESMDMGFSFNPAEFGHSGHDRSVAHGPYMNLT
jgi:hypothetical protein